MKKGVIVYLLRNNHVALGRKKTGHGIGKWNGFGGKVEPGETSKAAAVRELFEESGVKVEKNDLVKIAELIYIEECSWQIDVYTATYFSGEPKPSREMDPKWFDFDEIPYEEMWENDRLWLPKVLAGEKFKAKFWHDNEGNISKYKFGSL